jgi:hypothetical protein
VRVVRGHKELTKMTGEKPPKKTLKFCQREKKIEGEILRGQPTPGY